MLGPLPMARAEAQNTPRRLQVWHAVLQEPSPPAQPAHTALLCHGAAAHSSQVTQQHPCSAAPKPQPGKVTACKLKVTLKTCERTLRLHSQWFYVPIEDMKNPHNCFTFTVIMTQTESQPLLIHQILMLLF